MTSLTNAEMHADHRLWNSEHSMWMDDIQLWRNEHQKMLAEFQSAHELLQRQQVSLESHCEAIQKHEKVGKKHEHELAEQELAKQESGAKPVNSDKMAKNHVTTSNCHNQQRIDHEQMKRQHHSTIARWSLLWKAMQDSV